MSFHHAKKLYSESLTVPLSFAVHDLVPFSFPTLSPLQRHCGVPADPTLLVSAILRFDRLVSLVVKASASRAEDPGFKSHLRREDFSGSSHASDLIISTPVATLPGAWRYRVSARTGWPGVSIQCGKKFGLGLLSQCGGTQTCLGRSIPEIH